MEQTRLKKRLIGNLIMAGARNLKLSKKQEMKLQEWIAPYLEDEFGFSSDGIKKAEHAGAKHGNGAYWGRKWIAKRGSSKTRRREWRQEFKHDGSK